jgi:hypothetical protein
VGNWTLYDFKHLPDRCTVVPTAAFTGLMTATFAGGALLMLYFATIFFKHGGAPNLCFGLVFVAVAAMSAAMAIRDWKVRLTPLSIEGSGRVAYGDREFCAPGSVRAVCVVPAREGEAGMCEVAFRTNGDQLVFIPSPYFPAFATRQGALSLAAKFAEVLHVEVTESN